MKKVLPFLLYLLSFNVLGNQNYFYIEGRAGFGKLKIDEAFVSRTQEENVSKLGFGPLLGYQFKSNLNLELSSRLNLNARIFVTDGYSLEEYMFVSGYKIKVSDSLFLVPKAGYTQWKLKVQTDGPDDENHSGLDPVVGIGFYFSDRSRIEMTYDLMSTNYEFGSYIMGRAGVRFKF